MSASTDHRTAAPTPTHTRADAHADAHADAQPDAKPAAPLVLASSSPRRRALLAEAGFAARVVPPGVDDGVLDRGETPPLPWIAALAHLKARAGLERAAHALPRLPDAWVLGADTVVVKDGDVIGQPRDADEARAITRRLRRGEHRVVTAVALARLHRDEARATRDARPRVRWLIDTARVRVGDIPDTEIDAYIAGGGWSGKAGAYNFAERQSAGWPIECRDDPTTVMGLPMRRLTPLLRALVNGKSSGDNA